MLPRPIFAFLATFIVTVLKVIDKRVKACVVIPGKRNYFILMFGKVFAVPGPQEVMQFIMPRPFEKWLTLNDNDIIIEGGAVLLVRILLGWLKLLKEASLLLWNLTHLISFSFAITLSITIML